MISFALHTPGLAGLLGFGVTLYPHVALPSSGGPFGENSPQLIGFASLVYMVPQFAFFAIMPLRRWITFLLIALLLVMFFVRPSPPSSMMVIRWTPPEAGWYKVNVDGSAPSSPGPLFAGAIFRNTRGFFIAAFTKTMGWGYPLEAELASIIHAILFAINHGWHSLWGGI
ncbi:hypothetical protein ACS0TY_034243 [Phlomoides rotata]